MHWRFERPGARSGVQLHRILAPNPGPMTGDGTNTYVVSGMEGGPAAVVDPGPNVPGHLEAIYRAAGGVSNVAAVLVTHTHLDHTQAAEEIKRAAGAISYGFGRHGTGGAPATDALTARLTAAGVDLGGGEGADRRFAPQRTLADGQSVGAPGAAWRLTALHTPGHTSNHVSYVVEEAGGRSVGAVLSGDHVMGWSTSLVSPPDGDMAAYMASLRKLRARGETLLLPGHGEPVTDGHGRIDALIAHRSARRAAIIEAVRLGSRTPAEIRAIVYDALPPDMAPMAERNVIAHLLELVSERIVVLLPGGGAPAFALTRGGAR